MYVSYAWSDLLDDWEGRIKTIRNYNTNSHIVFSITYKWNISILDWVNYTKDETTYDGFTSESISYEWDEFLMNGLYPTRKREFIMKISR